MSFFRFLAGVVGGTALGLLFANKTGKNLREQLKGKDSRAIAEILGKELLTVGKDVKGTIEEVAESEEVQNFLKKGKKDFNNAVDTVKKNVKKKAPAVKKQVKKAADEATKEIKKAINKVAK